MTYTFQFADVWRSADELAVGAWLTVQLSLGAAALGMLIASGGAYARLEGPAWLSASVGAYVEVVRNTPLLVQLFLVFFGLPALGPRPSPEAAALGALALNFGAYATEILRAGVEGVPRGQVEAALALGLRPFQAFRKVVLFQALRLVFPALASQFVLLLLGSSIASAIAAQELTAAANDVQSRTFRSFEVYLVVTVIYLALASAFAGLFALIEARVLRRGDRVRAGAPPAAAPAPGAA